MLNNKGSYCWPLGKKTLVLATGTVGPWRAGALCPVGRTALSGFI